MRSHNLNIAKIFMELLGIRKHIIDNSSPSFHDLDDAIGSANAEWKRPWWVRSVDEPTVEIDWDNKERYDGRKMMQVSWHKYVGEEHAKNVQDLRQKKIKQWIMEEKPGFALRDRALDLAYRRSGTPNTSFIGSWAESSAHLTALEDPKLMVERPAPSPDELGVPSWKGSPEENSRMIRTALKHFGADQVGFLELDERIRKLIYQIDALDGKALKFEDVETAYETENKRVIPNNAKWVIVFSIRMSRNLIKRTVDGSPTAFSASATGLTYTRAHGITERLQNFLHMLGYEGLMGTIINGLAAAPALGVMAGLGELSRINIMISPEYGPLQRIFKVITDLPLAPTKPIDAGIMRFCRTCKKCAEVCPAGALSMETEPSWETAGPWNNPGHRAWFQDGIKCRTWWTTSTYGCSTCLAVCPFSNKENSLIHKFVQSTISYTSLLNGFFTHMHGIFGYDQPVDIESFWK